MAKRLATIALIAALWQGAARAETQPTGAEAHSPILVVPKWAEVPNGDEFVSLYPPAALRAGLTGRVTLECLVRRDGHLDQCRVALEDPTGVGFADATLKMVPKFTMRPATLNGAPVDNAQTRFTVKWALPVAGPNPVHPPPTLAEAQDRDPEAVPIARRIAELSSEEDLGLDDISQRFHQPPDTIVDANDKARREVLNQAFQTSLGEALQAERDRFAAALVFVFSRQELKDIEAFLETPSGAGFVRKLTVALGVTVAQQQPARVVMVDNWRKNYCAKVACNERELGKFQQIRADLVGQMAPKGASKDGRGP